MSTLWLVIVGIVIGVIVMFLFGKGSKTNRPYFNKNEVGIYHMNLYEFYDKRKETDFDKHASIYHWIVGLACQGRTDELETIYEDGLVSKNYNEKFLEFMQENKKSLFSMNKIAYKVESADIGYDMRDGESIGEYTDRKLLKRKGFMKHYDFFTAFDLNTLFENIS